MINKKLLFYSYTDIIRTTKKEPVKVTKYEWCLEMPLRCAKYETEIREVEYLEVSLQALRLI